MSAGLVENCLIRDSQVDTSTTSRYCYGGGAYMSGGTISGCEITGCQAGSAAKTALGNALYISSGTVTNCDIHANNGGYTSTSSAASASAVVYLKSGFLLNSKIHDNNKDGVPGVYQAGGTMAHCLIYRNIGKKYGGGLYKSDGNTYYCTIWGNEIAGDTTGISGLYQWSANSGTTKNCILVGNGPASSSGGSVSITGGTLQYNVVDKDIAEVSSKTRQVNNNTNNSDVKFADAANGDFTITSSMSPACGRATPLADFPVDFVGVARDAEAPTAGAYEYVQKTGIFEVDFAFDRRNGARLFQRVQVHDRRSQLPCVPAFGPCNV